MPGHLSSPPIVEVACGLIFAPHPDLDPVLMGAYWATREGDYPKRQFLPAISEPGTFVFGGMPPGRVWMLSPDQAWLVQLQADRFYVNWRKKEGAYPRFNQHEDTEGMLDRVLREYAAFATFCTERTRSAPRLLRAELTKIDHLVRGRHWADLADLAQMIPMLSAVIDAHEEAGFVVRRTTALAGGSLSVTLASTPADQPTTTTVVMETRLTRPIAGPDADLRQAFVAANATMNDAFDGLIPRSEHRRFREV